MRSKTASRVRIPSSPPRKSTSPDGLFSFLWLPQCLPGIEASSFAASTFADRAPAKWLCGKRRVTPLDRRRTRSPRAPHRIGQSLSTVVLVDVPRSSEARVASTPRRLLLPRRCIAAPGSPTPPAAFRRAVNLLQKKVRFARAADIFAVFHGPLNPTYFQEKIMKDKIVIAVAGCWLASWVSYMVVSPSPDAVHWGESAAAHAQKATLDASRRLTLSNTALAAK